MSSSISLSYFGLGLTRTQSQLLYPETPSFHLLSLPSIYMDAGALSSESMLTTEQSPQTIVLLADDVQVLFVVLGLSQYSVFGSCLMCWLLKQ